MQLKFVCLNLWFGGKLFDNILDFLKQEQPDIIALQEAFNGHDPSWARRYRSVDVLSQELGYPQSAFAAAFLDKRDGIAVESGNAILSRFPMIEEATTFYDIPYRTIDIEPGPAATHLPRNLQHAVIDAHGTSLNIFNTQGIWGEDGDDNDRRLAMGEAIAQKIADRPYVILAGDFNVQEGTKTTNLIERHARNIFKGERTSSFNMSHKTKPGYAEAIVDMMFISNDFKVLNHHMPLDDVSDHRPLVCELEIAES